MNIQIEETSKKISVIIPVYNKEEYLQECLDSVVKQTIYPDLEIICINDGSTDSCLDILKRNQLQYSNIVILNQENSGVAISRNRGILAASGEFIAFMDSDDYYIFDSTLETLYHKAKEHEAKICGGSFVTDHGTWMNISWPDNSINREYTVREEGFIEYSNSQFDYGYTRFIYDRKMLLDNNIFFPDYIHFEDPPFFVKAMTCAEKFYVVPIISYCYRVGHQNHDWSVKRTSHMMMGLIDNLNFSKEHFQQKLHKLTVWRCIKRYKQYIIQNISDPIISSLFLNLQSSVCNEWIDDDELLQGGPVRIILEEIRKLEKNNSTLTEKNKVLKAENQTLRKQLVKIEKVNANLFNSESYRLGKIILYIPRQIKRGITCLRKQG